MRARLSGPGRLAHHGGVSLRALASRIVRGRDSGSAAALSVISEGALVVTFLGTGVVASRVLGPEGRGELAAILTWSNLLTLLFMLGVPQATVFNLRRYPDKGPALVAAGLLLALGLGLVAAAAGLLILPIALQKQPASIVRFAELSMLLGPFTVVFYVLLGCVQAREAYRRYNLARWLAVGGLGLAALLALAALGALTPESASLARLLPPLLVAVVLLRPRPAPRGVTATGLREACRLQLTYGLAAHTGEISVLLSGEVDRAFVIATMSSHDSGLYAVAIGMASLILVFDRAAATVLPPRLIGQPLPALTELVGRATRVTILLAACTALAAIALAPSLVGLLYGAQFEPASGPFRVLAIASALTAAAAPLSLGLRAAGRPGVASIVPVVSILVTFPLLAVLVPRHGLVGAGFALVITAVGRFGLLLAFYPIFLGQRVPALWPTRADARTIAAVLRRGHERA